MSWKICTNLSFQTRVTRKLWDETTQNPHEQQCNTMLFECMYVSCVSIRSVVRSIILKCCKICQFIIIRHGVQGKIIGKTRKIYFHCILIIYYTKLPFNCILEFYCSIHTNTYTYRKHFNWVMNLEKPTEVFSLNKFWLSNRQHRIEQPEVMWWRWNVYSRIVNMRFLSVPKEFQYYPGQLGSECVRGVIMIFHCKWWWKHRNPHRLAALHFHNNCPDDSAGSRIIHLIRSICLPSPSWVVQ